MDLDRFKQINDTAGHLAGDQALATMGKVLQQATRSSDIVGRYGGDEFAIILPQTPTDEAVCVGQRILETLSDKWVPSPAGDLPLRSSVGVGSLPPHEISPVAIPRPVPHTYFQDMATLLIEQADRALFTAKRAGGSAIHSAEALSWAPIEKPLDL
jgi:diguanylate cyclase (GGDEF)-like protein